jgi:hypothetical protein
MLCIKRYLPLLGSHRRCVCSCQNGTTHGWRGFKMPLASACPHTHASVALLLLTSSFFQPLTSTSICRFHVSEFILHASAFFDWSHSQLAHGNYIGESTPKDPTLYEMGVMKVSSARYWRGQEMAWGAVQIRTRNCMGSLKMNAIEAC